MRVSAFAELDEVAGFDDGFGDAGALTWVPLHEPRSRIHQRPKGSRIISAWRWMVLDSRESGVGASDEEVLAVDFVMGDCAAALRISIVSALVAMGAPIDVSYPLS